MVFIILSVWHNVQGWNPVVGLEGTDAVEMPEHEMVFWTRSRLSLPFLHIATCLKANCLSFWEAHSPWGVLQPPQWPAVPKQSWCGGILIFWEGRSSLLTLEPNPKEGFVCICPEKGSMRHYRRHSAGEARDQMLQHYLQQWKKRLCTMVHICVWAGKITSSLCRE